MSQIITLACLSVVGCVALLVSGLGKPAPNAGAAATALSSAAQPTRMVILWTSGDRDVAIRMAFMYAQAAQNNKWWDRVTLVVWGPSAKLLAEDEELQSAVRKMKTAGVKVQACIACANSYGVTPKLRALGVEVKGMGKPLTDMLQSGWTLVSL